MVYAHIVKPASGLDAGLCHKSYLNPDYLAGAAGRLAGACVGAAAGADCVGETGVMLELLIGALTAKLQQMLNAHITIASVHVAFSIKSVVLR